LLTMPDRSTVEHAHPAPPPDPRLPEVTTVAEDEAVLHYPPSSGHRGPAVIHMEGLRPATEYSAHGVAFRTLDRPPGELLCRVGTVNDLHFGETHAGLIEGLPTGPVLSSGPGEDPYPETMNGAAADEMEAAGVDLVVAKGDLTDSGRSEELAAFVECYGRFGQRLAAIPGNHDVATGPAAYGVAPFTRRPPFAVELPGAIVALLDTTIARRATGRVPAEQVEWLDELAARADRPVLVMGHHHPWSPDYQQRQADYYGVRPDDSEPLVEVFARRPRLVGYLAGHTHRNRVRRFSATGPVAWVEVASVKEFPGCWAEYRVYEGGVLQVMRRISSPAALDWSDRTRAMFEGAFAAYSFGRLEDRCFRLPLRD